MIFNILYSTIKYIPAQLLFKYNKWRLSDFKTIMLFLKDFTIYFLILSANTIGETKSYTGIKC